MAPLTGAPSLVESHDSLTPPARRGSFPGKDAPVAGGEERGPLIVYVKGKQTVAGSWVRGSLTRRKASLSS
jgi:hypothetical protein